MKATIAQAVVGYQRFMYLLAKYPQKMEYIDFAPCPTIDLIWHTMLVQPAVYERFSRRLILHVVHHKVLPASKQTLIRYDERKDKEESLWRSEFGESIARYLLPPGVKLPVSMVMAFTCDVCDQRLQSERWHCTICTDFDLCSNCHRTFIPKAGSSHKKEHGMNRFLIG